MVGKGPLIIRNTRSHDPWGVVVTQVGRDTMTSGDPPVTLYNHLWGSYTSISSTTMVPSYVRVLSTWVCHHVTTSTNPESPHSLGFVQGKDQVMGVPQRSSNGWDRSPKYTHLSEKVPSLTSSGTIPTPGDSQRVNEKGRYHLGRPKCRLESVLSVSESIRRHSIHKGHWRDNLRS